MDDSKDKNKSLSDIVLNYWKTFAFDVCNSEKSHYIDLETWMRDPREAWDFF